MSSAEKTSNKLLLVSFAALIYILSGAQIDKINLGFISFKNISAFADLTFLLLIIYFIWDYYHFWVDNIASDWKKNIEKFYCEFLTKRLLRELKKSGSQYCRNYVSDEFPPNKSYNAESSWFIYDAHYKFGFGSKQLRVEIEKESDYGGINKVGHVVHIFNGDALKSLRYLFWLEWTFHEKAFRVQLLPLVLSTIALVLLIFNLI